MNHAESSLAYQDPNHACNQRRIELGAVRAAMILIGPPQSGQVVRCHCANSEL